MISLYIPLLVLLLRTNANGRTGVNIFRRDTTGKKEPQNPCAFGTPLSSVFCDRASTDQECPKGYSCNIDPLDRFAVCCPEDLCQDGDEFITCFIDPCDFTTCPAFPDAQCVANYCGGCYAEFFVGKRNVSEKCEVSEHCPDGSFPVACKADPCEVTKCPQHPRARCVPNYCGGCYAEFFVGKKNVTEKCRDRELCPDGSSPVDCLVDPCEDKKCSPHPRARCVANYCGGCYAEFFVGKRNVTKKCEVSELCPDGSFPIACKADPCEDKKCSQHPRARCVANYCGGCYAEFFIGKRNVTEKCEVSELCPDGRSPVDCLVDPCQDAKCFQHPRARCVANYCGGCYAEFFVGKRNVTEKCEVSELCPDGSSPVECLIDPCQDAKCSQHPRARCVANYCGGCYAEFFVGEKNVTDNCEVHELCPDGSSPVNCLVDPCEAKKCSQYPNSHCVANYCGGCYAEFFVGKRNVTEKCEVSELCPDGSSPVECLIDPCQDAKCSQHPRARCVANYCGGCYAEFFVGEKNVTDNCEVHELCPDGSSPVNCLVDPCEAKKCSQYPNSHCVTNYCGGCYAEFFVGKRNVTEKCEVSELCPDGSSPVECLIDPCQDAKCSQHPRARCVANYCGGCYAEFFVGEKNVTDNCEVHELCPDGSSPVNCFVDPCEAKKCSQYPNSHCVANYCGGCYAEFFVGEKNVTDNCEVHELCPDGSSPVNCFVDPCEAKKCSQYPNSHCVANYCGGCYAEFFVGEKNVTDNCEVHELCPDGSSPVNCFVDPCEAKKCSQYPNSHCVGNYCGGCYAEFFVGEKNVTDNCEVHELCPDGSSPVNCFVDPCKAKKCSQYPNSHCVANYCGGCYAEFFVGEKNVTDNCEVHELCPDGSSPVNCFVDPCKAKKCSQYPNSHCVANYCGGCYAEFFVGEKNVTDNCEVHELCPDGSSPVNCFVDPCKAKKCSQYPNSHCVANYCGGCYAEFFVGKRNVTEKCEVSELCPDGSSPVECLIDPCQDAKCSQHPRARCVANYCGGCYAEFFVGEKNVTDNCEVHELCPDGSSPVNCFVDPCKAKKCSQYPNSHCVANYCGGCYAEFFVGEKNVTDNCEVHELCPDGSSPVNCFVDPCKAKKCSQYPNSHCVANYCGGCYAEFFVGEKNVTDNCEVHELCPDGSSPVNCFVDPCKAKKCSQYPNSHCVANYCGGCYAEFFVGKRNVTEKCEVSELCPDGSSPVECLIDPCQDAKCSQHPRARCVANYCGGCYAEFFVGEKNVTDNCEVHELCPDGSSPVNCFVDPCKAKKCSQYPNSHCVANYCGGCYAEFFVGEKNVTDNCEVHELCPDGSSPVNCFVDPCKAKKCSQYPNSHCVANYCGGCYAEFFVGKRNVTEKCEVSELCPDGSSPVECLIDPCQDAKCSQHPRARCVANYCGGCYAEFFVGEKNVTDNCEVHELCPDGSSPVNCFVDPCKAKKCSQYPNSHCVANYCGGCNAEFFVGVENVSEKCEGSDQS